MFGERANECFDARPRDEGDVAPAKRTERPGVAHRAGSGNRNVRRARSEWRRSDVYHRKRTDFCRRSGFAAAKSPKLACVPSPRRSATSDRKANVIVSWYAPPLPARLAIFFSAEA